MKVVLIYRPAARAGFSIETIFRTLASEMRKEIEVVEYVLEAGTAQLRDILKLRQLAADIYHVTGDVHYVVPFLPMGRVVLTIHDIGHYLYTLQGYRKRVFRLLWLSWPMRAAAAITVVSVATQHSLVKNLDFPERKLHVIENCHGTSFHHVTRAFDRACPRILQVGLQAHKNVINVVKALQGIRCRLVLVGQPTAPLCRALAQHATDHEFRSNLSVAEIVAAYDCCDIVTFVSFVEGFGMPIIEAQVSGRALVTSAVSPMQDVAGENACTVSPDSIEEIRLALQRLIGDQVYRDQVIASGLENARRFSPAVIAGRYMALYRSVHQRLPVSTQAY